MKYKATIQNNIDLFQAKIVIISFGNEKDIHPKYNIKTKATYCGAVFEVGSTMPEIKWKFAVNVILYTGNEKVMDTAGRRTFPISVSRFCFCEKAKNKWIGKSGKKSKKCGNGRISE